MNFEFSKKYNRESFLDFLQDQFLPEDFEIEEKKVSIDKTFHKIQEIIKLGQVKSLRGISNKPLFIYEIKHESEFDPRVTLTKEAFDIMKNEPVERALIVFYSEKSNNYRFSLMTIDFRVDGKKIMKEFSNPKRYSFYLGPDAKTHTPTKMLVKNGRIKNFLDLSSRFSIEVVNNDFFNGVKEFFDRLTQNKELELPGFIVGSELKDFAVRLIGRIMFCWFLKQKTGSNNLLIPKDILSSESAKNTENYYHNILEPLFFELLNTPKEERNIKFRNNLYDLVPYLNGGLFNPQHNDYYEFDTFTYYSKFFNTLKISDNWFVGFLELLETYNFTIDESTYIDQELSLDPEMLGIIFEKLLGEISSNTGESNKKKTGSFYTPRSIVEYMVDESLVQYLLGKTNIEEDKIRALISYNLEDDKLFLFSNEEKKIIIENINKLKCLDPACGSGAFPIGMLQKILHVLQCIDPNCEIWLEDKIKDIPDNIIKEKIKLNYKTKSFDYIRKLSIIKDSIFGIDIQHIAVEISRLRCFLTLIVEVDIDETKPNRNIEPLPNLDFKFVCANALVLAPEVQVGLFNDKNYEDKFQKEFEFEVEKYFNSTRHNKSDAMNKIHRLIDQKVKEKMDSINNLISGLNNNKHRDILAGKNRNQINEQSQQLCLWESYKNIFENKPVDFFEIKYFFPSAKNGFDIVIGNPPYISAVTMARKNLQKEYFKKVYPLATGSYDIYILFLLRGIKLINNSGVYSWIIPNKFLIADYAKQSKELLINESGLINSIDVSSFGVFRDVGIYPIIITGKKGHDKTYKELLIDKYEDLRCGLFKEVGQLKKYKTFKEFGIGIYSGTTGFQAHDIIPFIISNKDINSIPFIVSGSVDKYCWSNKNVRYMGNHYDKAFINKNNFIADSKWKFWNSPKIVIAGMTKVIESVYSSVPVALGVGIYGIYDFGGFEPKCLNGLLNSRYMTFYFQQKFKDKHLAGGYLGINKSTIENLPLVNIKKSDQLKISNIVDQILEIKKRDKDVDIKDLEKEVDQVVYRLYDLTKEEIEIVENSSKK